MLAVQETRSLISPTQLADPTAPPAWSAEEGPLPWLLTRMLAMAIDRDHLIDAFRPAGPRSAPRAVRLAG